MYKRLSGTCVGRLLGFGTREATRAWDLEMGTGAESTNTGNHDQTTTSIGLLRFSYPARARNHPGQPGPRQESYMVIVNSSIIVNNYYSLSV